MTERKSQEEFERLISEFYLSHAWTDRNDYPLEKQQGGRTGAKEYPRQLHNPNLSRILSMIEETEDPFLLFLCVSRVLHSRVLMIP
jgi:hypothetical protein